MQAIDRLRMTLQINKISRIAHTSITNAFLYPKEPSLTRLPILHLPLFSPCCSPNLLNTDARSDWDSCSHYPRLALLLLLFNDYGPAEYTGILHEIVQLIRVQVRDTNRHGALQYVMIIIASQKGELSCD